MRRLVCAAAALGLAACTDLSLGRVDTQGPEELLPSPSALPFEVVFATDGTSLFQLDVAARAFTTLGTLDGCALAVTELAMSDRSGLYAAGYANGQGALYRIDPRTGRCTLAAGIDTAAPLALSFVPDADRTGESLVAYGSGGALVRFDATQGWSGMVPSKPMTPRGCAMIAMPDGPTLVSMVENEGTAAAANVLAEVDPRTGQTLAVRGRVPGPRVLEGLAIGGLALYGFSDHGEVLRLSFGEAGVDVTAVPTTGGPARFTGAASARILPGTPR